MGDAAGVSAHAEHELRRVEPGGRYAGGAVPAELQRDDRVSPTRMLPLINLPASWNLVKCVAFRRMRQRDGSMISQEIAAPAMCRRITALNSTTHTFMELNSVIDWPWNQKLHQSMVDNPSWRLKRENGSDWVMHSQ